MTTQRFRICSSDGPGVNATNDIATPNPRREHNHAHCTMNYYVLICFPLSCLAHERLRNVHALLYNWLSYSGRLLCHITARPLETVMSRPRCSASLCPMAVSIHVVTNSKINTSLSSSLFSPLNEFKWEDPSWTGNTKCLAYCSELLL